MKPSDWTLLVIAAGRTPLQPVQLQKALFLLGKNLSLETLRTETFYDFYAYDYGPFSTTVYSDAEWLATEGLVAISQPPEARFKRFHATEPGAARAADLRRDIGGPALSYLDRVVAWVQRLTFNQLVRSIYAAYPEMRTNSVFQEQSS